jgi:hypothetical protein
MNRIKEVLETKRIEQQWMAEQPSKIHNMVNAVLQKRQHQD